jgi:hypothetical protein
MITARDPSFRLKGGSVQEDACGNLKGGSARDDS